MKIHQLKRSTWLVDKANRRGRWDSSGRWNYSGKWHKWQKARSGHSMKPFFEWWQTSIVQRIPKAKWFKRHYKLVTNYKVINLSKIEADTRITDWMEITKTLLRDLWYIKDETLLVKILWDWELTKKITFSNMDKFSKTAEAKLATPGTKSDKWFKIYKTIEKKVKKIITKKPVEKKIVEKKSVEKVEAPKTKAVEKKVVAKKTTTTKSEPKAKATEKKTTVKKK